MKHIYNKLQNLIRNSTTGFTLIELLVVIAIIGILSSVVLASLNNSRAKARDTKRIADIKQLQLALELYFDANAEFPDALSDLATTYIAVIPVDPSTGANYSYGNYDNDTRSACAFADVGSCAFYHLGALLEQGAGSKLFLGDSDKDGLDPSGGGLDGVSTAAACGTSGATVAQDLCYDVTP